jgi:hypothetical protein
LRNSVVLCAIRLGWVLEAGDLSFCHTWQAGPVVEAGDWPLLITFSEAKSGCPD